MKKLIVFIDSGDTLIDESTQVYDDRGIVQRAQFVKGAKELLLQLREKEFRVCLVADGEGESFDNVYRDNGMRSFFEAWVISEKVGVEKPDSVMFDYGLVAMDLNEEDKPRIVMIGNNLKKDIAGANRYGITSIWLDWSPRYFHNIEQEDWAPDYIVHQPEEIISVLEQIEETL